MTAILETNRTSTSGSNAGHETIPLEPAGTAQAPEHPSPKRKSARARATEVQSDTPDATKPRRAGKAKSKSREKDGSTQSSNTSRTETVLKKLRLARGATIAQITETTGWQSHSVRGFLSGVVRKKLGLKLESEVGKDGQRRYRIVEESNDASMAS